MAVALQRRQAVPCSRVSVNRSHIQPLPEIQLSARPVSSGFAARRSAAEGSSALATATSSSGNTCNTVLNAISRPMKSRRNTNMARPGMGMRALSFARRAG